MKGRGIRAEYNYAAVTILRLSRREFYRMNPGLFFDLMQIHSKATHPNKEPDFD